MPLTQSPTASIGVLFGAGCDSAPALSQALLYLRRWEWQLNFFNDPLVLQRHVRQLSMAQAVICQELKSFLRISIRTWLMDQNPCKTSHFLAIGVLTQRWSTRRLGTRGIRGGTPDFLAPCRGIEIKAIFQDQRTADAGWVRSGRLGAGTVVVGAQQVDWEKRLGWW